MGLYRVYTYRNGKCHQCYVNALSIEDSKAKTIWLSEDDTGKGKQSCRIWKPSKIAIKKADALEEYHKSWTRYINGNDVENWSYEKLPKEKIAINRILKLREQSFKVKCGYFTTRIRNHHDRIILYK